MGAGYLLQEKPDPSAETADLDAIVADAGARLRAVFENDEFRIYRIAGATR